MEIVRKITAATLSANVKLKGITESKYLGRIYGVAKDYESVTTQYGEAQKFKGEFIATKADGEICMSAVCYLPGTVSNLLASALKNDNVDGVKFGFDITAEPNEKSATGYSWKIQPLMEVKPTESLLAFADSFPAIPSDKVLDEVQPVPVPQVEPAKETHKKK
jgi:hypothetical protein